MTTIETNLVLRLRQKMGDYPTKVITIDDVGKSVYIEGALKVAANGDIGSIAYLAESLVWTDAEYLQELNSSRVRVFKGKVTSLETLSEFEQEVVLLDSRINKLTELATDNTRYARYSIGEAQAEKASPSEIINIANALKSMLKDLLEEGTGGSEIGAIVEEFQYQRYDKNYDLYVPTKLDNQPPNIPFSLEQMPDGSVRINVSKVMIPKYYTHYLQKGVAPSVGGIIKQWYSMTTYKLLDTDVVPDTTYLYTLTVEDINGSVNSNTLTITTPKVTP